MPTCMLSLADVNARYLDRLKACLSAHKVSHTEAGSVQIKDPACALGLVPLGDIPRRDTGPYQPFPSPLVAAQGLLGMAPSLVPAHAGSDLCQELVSACLLR